MTASIVLAATLTASTPSPTPAPTAPVLVLPAPATTPAPAPTPIHWRSSWAGDLQLGVGGTFGGARDGFAGELHPQLIRMSQLESRPAGGFFLEGLSSAGRRPEAGGGASFDFALPALQHHVRIGPALGVLAGPDGTDAIAALELTLRVPVGNPGYNHDFGGNALRIEERQNLRDPSDRATIATLQFSVDDSILCFAWRFVPSE